MTTPECPECSLVMDEIFRKSNIRQLRCRICGRLDEAVTYYAVN